jgi:serine/threonine-protein kinase 19
MSSSSKRARLRYAESSRTQNETPDVYNQRRKEVQKVTERIEQENDDEFDMFNDGESDNAVVQDAFDTYNALRYFIYSASLPPSSKFKDVNTSLPRICFLHQLYSILPDNTAVDRELVSKPDIVSMFLSTEPFSI